MVLEAIYLTYLSEFELRINPKLVSLEIVLKLSKGLSWSWDIVNHMVLRIHFPGTKKVLE